jgi:hypothetical protein
LDPKETSLEIPVTSFILGDIGLPFPCIGFNRIRLYREGNGRSNLVVCGHRIDPPLERGDIFPDVGADPWGWFAVLCAALFLFRRSQLFYWTADPAFFESRGEMAKFCPERWQSVVKRPVRRAMVAFGVLPRNEF